MTARTYAIDECEPTPERCACGKRLKYEEQVSESQLCAECEEELNDL